MTEYIKRSHIADRIEYHLSHSVGGEHYAYEVCQKEIQDIPNADVEEVRHGYWKPIDKTFSNNDGSSWTEKYLQCSLCDYERRDTWLPRFRPHYCEECGAKMDGEKDGK